MHKIIVGFSRRGTFFADSLVTRRFSALLAPELACSLRIENQAVVDGDGGPTYADRILRLMSEDSKVDFETFKETRSKKFRKSLDQAIRKFTHRGWTNADAQVRSCKLIHPSNRLQQRDGSMPIGGYAVTFTYAVNGKTYDGIAISPDKVEENDTFVIRYNPDHPEENNSFESEFRWIDGFMSYYAAFLFLAFLALVAGGLYLRRH